MIGKPFSRRLHRALPFLAVFLVGIAIIATGCSSAPAVNGPAKQFIEILNDYPIAQEPLRIPKLTAASAADIAPVLRGKAVTVIVHPAYSLFFREPQRSAYTASKYDLLKFQLDSEARFISEIAATDNLLILLLPGDFQKESLAPLSYTYYLNSAAGTSTSVYYLTSETWSSGSLSTDTLIIFYGFLKKIGAKQLLIGGGYIGRCQRDFYNQMATYMDGVNMYIVPEISAISPDDISDRESAEVLAGLQQGDYGPVRAFIEKKGQGTNIVAPVPVDPGI
jgi:hypothetical protein